VVSHQLVRAEDRHADRDFVQRIVDDSRERLSIPQEVRVSLVPANALVVSVARQPGQDGLFSLSFEQAFLEKLTDDEIRAVVAHELGHVWIFTHHPYLQTEQLANAIAMRLVTRESLELVYDKVHERVGGTVDLARNLGDKPDKPPALR
jgi:Zn-dependent protease with chaperone function